MDDEYGMASNLRQYMDGTPLFTIQPPPEMLSNHRSLAAMQQYESSVVLMSESRPAEFLSHGLHHDNLHSDSMANNNVICGGGFGGLLEVDGGGLGGDGGSARWPRQETLTLLEIRSRLDAKFKEANQKGHLWDEVSRIMYDEHGYQRSGKKCREKFENLYKYYKKTKEGKAGRQDGKHYRFFRQLEAIYGETNTTNKNNYTPTSTSDPHFMGTTSFPYNSNVVVISNINNNQELISHHHQASKHSQENSLSLSNSWDFETTSSEDSEHNHDNENSSSVGKRKKRSKRGWKTKIKDFIDAQMRKLMAKQEASLDKMMKAIEHKEQERMMREETWKKQEEERIEKEHKFWDKERAWIEARDSALMEALHKLTSKEIVLNDDASETITNLAIRGGGEDSNWQECEITRLLQLRSGMEPRFVQQVGCGEMVWEDIAAKMASFGYNRSPLVCKNKWESINDYLIKFQRKGKESSSASCGGYFQGNNDHSNCHQVGGGPYCDKNNETAPTTSSSRGGINDHGGGNSPPNCTTGLSINDNCFRYFLGDADNNLWENYGVKLCKADNSNNNNN
ncbi:hypothetical protein LIER_36631 [Lithospermum erythrorhizon]|uniref:Myb-like domain-containing protein n=1 Tax=Lithospermum erythrorhizon TaxID=34254 RepID=A0AAV3PCI3_LITER